MSSIVSRFHLPSLHKQSSIQHRLVDVDVFSDFYNSTHLAVFRYIYSLMGGPREDSEDLTAETYFRAWKARRSFRGNEQAVLGWVFQIARRLIVDRYRRLKVRPLLAEEFPDNLPTEDSPPEEAFLITEQQQILWKQLNTLADETREILVLRYMLGWRVNQVADFMGIPENTVSVIIHRALVRLLQSWPSQEL